MTAPSPAPFRLFPRAGEPQGAQARIVGARPPRLTDLYYSMVAASWSTTLVLIVLMFLAINAVFGALFMWAGGILNARQGDFSDAFFFSVQTFATIGYGQMAPQTLPAHIL